MSSNVQPHGVGEKVASDVFVCMDQGMSSLRMCPLCAGRAGKFPNIFISAVSCTLK